MEKKRKTERKKEEKIVLLFESKESRSAVHYHDYVISSLSHSCVIVIAVVDDRPPFCNRNGNCRAVETGNVKPKEKETKKIVPPLKTFRS